MKKIIIIIAAIVLVAAGASYFIFFAGGDEEGKAEEVELTSYSPGDYFVTNVKDSSRLLKITVVLMLNTDKLTEELDANQYLIRDTIISIMRDLSEEDITSDNIQNWLRLQMADDLNSVLNIDNIVTVYFSDLVMQ